MDIPELFGHKVDVITEKGLCERIYQKVLVQAVQL
jgi:predicted nucleotidyltransferase